MPQTMRGYPATSDRSRGWLRYLHRKATTPDNWDKNGRPHPHWDALTGEPTSSWHRFDLLDSSYAMALMADTTPAWREVYSRVLDELAYRHTGYWAAKDWLDQIGHDPRRQYYPEGWHEIMPAHLLGNYDVPGWTANGVAPWGLQMDPVAADGNLFFKGWFLVILGLYLYVSGDEKWNHPFEMIRDGDLYAMPLDGDIHIMFYNKVAFTRPENKAKFKDQFGYELEPPQTWTQWDDMAKFFNGWGWDGSDNKLFGAGASLKENNFSFYWWQQRFFSYGGQYFDKDLNPLVNSKPGVRALQELMDTVQYYPPGVLLFESEEPKTMLIKGEVPMLVSWTSTGKRVGDANQSLIVDKAGYSVLPGNKTPDGKILRTVPNTGGRSFAISKYSDKKDATAVVLAFVSSPRQSLKIVMHPKTLMDPWRTSHLTSEEFGAAWPGATEYLAAIKDSFPYTVPGIQIPGGLEYRRRLAEMITRGLQKSMTAQQALDEAADHWNKITKRRRKKRQLEFWNHQMEAMAEAGITFRPELAEK